MVIFVSIESKETISHICKNREHIVIFCRNSKGLPGERMRFDPICYVRKVKGKGVKWPEGVPLDHFCKDTIEKQLLHGVNISFA
jgi:hypothetical protein